MDDWNYQPAKDHGLAPVERWRSVQRESGLAASIARLGWRVFIRGYLSLWHRLSVEGREFLPVEPPFVVIANHTSHLDAVTLASALPARLRDRVLPVAAGDTFFDTPMHAAFAAALMNALPMWRRNCGRHALEQLRERLVEQPCSYILFPEGTRSRSGQMGPFKPGLGMMIAGTKVPVVPCFLTGAYEAWPPTARLPRPRRVRLKIGAPLRFDDLQNNREGWEQIAERARQAVVKLGLPLQSDSK